MRNIAAALAALIAAAGLAACGSSSSSDTSSSKPTSSSSTGSTGQVIQSNPANKKVTVTIGSKNFTEEFILGNIYAQALKAAGYNVKTQLNLGSEQIALKALKSGQIDAYPEYTGTALTSFFKVKTTDIPTDPAKAYNQAKADFAQQGLTALPPTPFTDSNAVAVTQATAKKLGVKNISDLKSKASTITLAGTPECRQRQDCLLGLQQVYGLKFKSFTPVDRPCATRCCRRARPTPRSCSRPTVRSRPTRGHPQRRQEHLPALQRHPRGRRQGAAEGGAGLREDGRAGPEGHDHAGAAGAQLARRPRQAEAGGRRHRVPEGVGLHQVAGRQRPDEPKPPLAARAVARASATAIRLGQVDAHDEELGDAVPGATAKGSARSVLSSSTRSSPR